MLRITRGFTLFELLLVIVIMTSSYLLIIPFLQQTKSKHFEFQELKSYLKSINPHHKVTLVCIKDCKKCYIFTDNQKIETDVIKGNLVSYAFNNRYLEEVDFTAPEFFDTHEKICFKYQVDSQNDLGDELFVKYQDKIYYFSPYFNETIVYKDLSEAADKYKILLDKLKD